MPRSRKIHTGMTATERVNASVRALKQRGGARKTWRLSPQAHAALKTVRRLTLAPTETAVIERLLLDEQRRLASKLRNIPAAHP